MEAAALEEVVMEEVARAAGTAAVARAAAV
jgi:hypothetical protein